MTQPRGPARRRRGRRRGAAAAPRSVRREERGRWSEIRRREERGRWSETRRREERGRGGGGGGEAMGRRERRGAGAGRHSGGRCGEGGASVPPQGRREGDLARRDQPWRAGDDARRKVAADCGDACHNVGRRAEHPRCTVGFLFWHRRGGVGRDDRCRGAGQGRGAEGRHLLLVRAGISFVHLRRCEGSQRQSRTCIPRLAPRALDAGGVHLHAATAPRAVPPRLRRDQLCHRAGVHVSKRADGQPLLHCARRPEYHALLLHAGLLPVGVRVVAHGDSRSGRRACALRAPRLTVTNCYADTARFQIQIQAFRLGSRFGSGIRA